MEPATAIAPAGAAINASMPRRATATLLACESLVGTSSKLSLDLTRVTASCAATETARCRLSSLIGRWSPAREGARRARTDRRTRRVAGARWRPPAARLPLTKNL